MGAWAAANMSSALLRSTLVAPRNANSRIGRGIVSEPRRGPVVSAGPGRRSQALDLRPREPAALPRTQPSQAQRAEGNALELQHPVPHRLAPPPDLALAALVDDQLQDVALEPAHPGQSGVPVLQVDAEAQSAQGALSHPAAPHPGSVGPRHFPAATQEGGTELAIVGKQVEPAAGRVQPAHRIPAAAEPVP